MPGAVPDLTRRISRIQQITIAWMCIEAGVSLWAAVRAKSPALLAFGGDSAVELLSAVVVWRRFQHNLSDEHAEHRAARIAGALLIVLAIFIAVAAALSLFGYNEPKPSYMGVAVLIAAALLMPFLAWQKRKLSAEAQSAALRADAAESMLCAYLSIIALAGLTVRMMWGFTMADPSAALLIIPFILREAHEAFEGRSC
ncbi:MAG TPA: cation transporter [Candidatus Sulfotelmatobacter sp.]|nr:cation transporter [Candidatus Sulfotelmatobacter sp.]